ncbi:unnamed protein product, partial [Laminaria digitata]
MLVERVAILAVTLLCCKWLPRQSTSFVVTEQSPLRRGNRRRPTEPRPATAAATTGVVFVIAKQPLTGAEGFGSRYPQTGRFESRHTRGPVPAAAGKDEDENEAGEPWSTALAALAASGSALALQTDPNASSPSSSSEEEPGGGEGDRLGGRAQRYQRRWRQRGPRLHSNQRRLDDGGDLDSADMLCSLLQRLQTELSSNVNALSSWSSTRCSQLRDSAVVAASAAAAAATHRPLLFSHRSSVALRELQLAGAQAVDCAARRAQSGLDHVTWRLSGA